MLSRFPNTKFRIDPGTGNIGIGLGSGVNAVEKLTVQGNSSISGFGYASGFKASTLTLTGIGSGILTVDGFGNVTTTSMVISNVFNQSVAGYSFSDDNILIKGTTTAGIAKLKVKGDLSANGQVIASASFQPIGTASLVPTTLGGILKKQRIYIPAGTNFLAASVNAYEFVASGTSIIYVYINGVQLGSVIIPAVNDETTSVQISNINVSGLSGTFQTLEIRGNTTAIAQGIIVQGYTVIISD